MPYKTKAFLERSAFLFCGLSLFQRIFLERGSVFRRELVPLRVARVDLRFHDIEVLRDFRDFIAVAAFGRFDEGFLERSYLSFACADLRFDGCEFLFEGTDDFRANS